MTSDGSLFRHRVAQLFISEVAQKFASEWLTFSLTFTGDF